MCVFETFPIVRLHVTGMTVKSYDELEVKSHDEL